MHPAPIYMYSAVISYPYLPIHNATFMMTLTIKGRLHVACQMLKQSSSENLSKYVIILTLHAHVTWSCACVVAASAVQCQCYPMGDAMTRNSICRDPVQISQRPLVSENYKVPGLSCGVVCMILWSAISVEHRLVTEGGHTTTAYIQR